MREKKEVKKEIVEIKKKEDFYGILVQRGGYFVVQSLPYSSTSPRISVEVLIKAKISNADCQFVQTF